MPESIEEYVQILISKNTYERLQGLAELIEPVPSATCDSVIGKMLLDLDYLTDGDKVMYLKENTFEISDIDKFLQRHNIETEEVTKPIKPELQEIDVKKERLK